MNADFEHYYEAGLAAMLDKDYLSAAECFKKAVNFEKEYAEGWYYAGWNLVQLRRFADAGMYFHRALSVFNQRIAIEENPAYNYYWRARVEAMMSETADMYSSLSQAIARKSAYAELAHTEPDFEPYRERADFIALTQIAEPEAENNTENTEEETDTESPENIIFASQEFIAYELAQESWYLINVEYNEETDFTERIPSLRATYRHNAVWAFWLDYFAPDEVLLVLENREDEEDVQLFRFQIPTENFDWLAVILHFQALLDAATLTDFIEALIEVCPLVVMELPDGRVVKVS
jgi:tetratricopeptide (TPR) repeat protein